MNIIERITEYLNRFMVFPTEEQAVAIALWVLHTYTFEDGFPLRPVTTPYLYVNSTEPQCGKSTLIDILEPIVLNPERGDDMTSAVMFRLIESVHPTLFMDEVDTVFTGGKANEEKRGVLNGGYKRSGYIWRTVPGADGPEPRKFGTFGPKLMAGIDNGKLPATLLTRSLEIVLMRVAELDDEGQLVGPDGRVREIAYDFAVEEAAAELLPHIEAFVEEWKANFETYRPKPIPGISPRTWEVFYPLCQIAHAVGIEAEIRETLVRLVNDKPRRDTPGVALLRKIKAAFDMDGASKLHTETIIERCGMTGDNLSSGKRLGAALREFHLQPTGTYRIGNKYAKGYARDHFTAAWEANGIK